MAISVFQTYELLAPYPIDKRKKNRPRLPMLENFKEVEEDPKIIYPKLLGGNTNSKWVTFCAFTLGPEIVMEDIDARDAGQIYPVLAQPIIQGQGYRTDCIGLTHIIPEIFISTSSEWQIIQTVLLAEIQSHFGICKIDKLQAQVEDQTVKSKWIQPLYIATFASRNVIYSPEGFVDHDIRILQRA